jgi:hypothetical protein
MKPVRLSLFLCSLLPATAIAAPESGSAGGRVIPDLFSNKTHTKLSEGKPFTNSPSLSTPSQTAVKPTEIETVKKTIAITKTTGLEKPATEAKATGKPLTSDKAFAPVNTLNAWAAAWSAKEVDKYLAFYAPDFHTPNGVNRADWEAQRRERITKPAHIQVQVRKVIVDFADDTHATVKFHQSYYASTINSTDNKTLLMVKSGDTWLIQEERKN